MGSDAEGNEQENDAAIAEAHQNALLTESDHEDDYDVPELQHANTILQPDGLLGREGMNAEYDLPSGD